MCSSKIKAQVAWAKCHFRCTARCPHSSHHHGGWSCQPPGREATRIAHDQPWRSSATASDKKIGNLEAKREMLRQKKFRQWTWQKPSYLCLCAASFHHHFFGREFVSPHDTRPPLLISGGKWAPSWHCWDGAGRTISLLEICLWPCTKAFVWSLNYIIIYCKLQLVTKKMAMSCRNTGHSQPCFFLLGNGFYFASAMCKAQVLNSSRCCQRQQDVLQTNWRLKNGAAPFRPHHCTRCYPGPLGHWRASPGSQSVSPSGGWSKSLKKSMTCSFLHDKIDLSKRAQMTNMSHDIYEMLCFFWNIRSVYIRYIYTYFKMHTYLYIYIHYTYYIITFCRQRAWAKHRTSEWQKIDEIWTASSHRNNNLQTGYSYKIVFVITCAASLQKAMLLTRRCSFPKNHLHHHTCHPFGPFSDLRSKFHQSPR